MQWIVNADIHNLPSLQTSHSLHHLKTIHSYTHECYKTTGTLLVSHTVCNYVSFANIHCTTGSCQTWFKNIVGQENCRIWGLSPTSLQIDDNSVESVNSFVYLGSLQKYEDNNRPDMKCRTTGSISHVLLEPDMARQKVLQLSTKIRLYQALVMSICSFCYTLQKLGHYSRVTKKRRRHST